MEQCYPIGLSEMMEMSHLGTVKYTRHLPLDDTDPEPRFFPEAENTVKAAQT